MCVGQLVRQMASPALDRLEVQGVSSLSPHHSGYRLQHSCDSYITHGWMLKTPFPLVTEHLHTDIKFHVRII